MSKNRKGAKQVSPADVKKCWRDLAKQFTEAGGVITITSGNHLRWSLGQGVVISALTPSDHRAIKNTTSRINRLMKGE